MSKECPCCREKVVYLQGDNIGKVQNYYGNCECGAKIDYDVENGSIIRDRTICPSEKE